MSKYLDISKKQQLVYDVILANPGCQDNDADLIAAVWRYEGWNDARGLEQNIMGVSRPETITRRRRELHEMGLITYSKDADKQRFTAFINERDHAADEVPHAVSWLDD